MSFPSRVNIINKKLNERFPKMSSRMIPEKNKTMRFLSVRVLTIEGKRSNYIQLHTSSYNFIQVHTISCKFIQVHAIQGPFPLLRRCCFGQHGQRNPQGQFQRQQDRVRQNVCQNYVFTVAQIAVMVKEFSFASERLHALDLFKGAPWTSPTPRP